jgi:hypothetical protein
VSRQPATERQVWDWLADLGKLVAPGNASVREASGHYLPLLIAEFDSRDFNADSRAFVARHCKFWPSYGELCELLAKWPKPVPTPRGGAADAGNLVGTDLHWFRYFYKRQAEGFRAARDGQPPSSRETILALVRDKSLPAWCRITGNPMPEHHDPTEDELQAVHEAVLRARRGGDRRPEEQQEAGDYRTPHRPNLPPKPARDVTLKGDALRASRAARGLTTPLADEAA